eukprot:scaffold250027_cov21-Tisochrysis_lutea.AAC.1
MREHSTTLCHHLGPQKDISCGGTKYLSVGKMLVACLSKRRRGPFSTTQRTGAGSQKYRTLSMLGIIGEEDGEGAWPSR